MEKIIDPVDVALIKAELTEDTLLCKTHKGGNFIHVVDGKSAPNTLREIGRLRETAFREAGGCSGKSMDIDEFDLMDRPYRQIIIWSPEDDAIIGGYRYILGPDVIVREDGQPHLASADQFHFSEKFVKEYLPHMIELGRSFVAPAYQSSKMGAKSLFALDNLWDGIFAVLLQHPDIHHIFGKVTMYASFDSGAKDLILHFLWKHFGDKEGLIRPHNPMMPVSNPGVMDLILHEDKFKDDYKLLKEAVRKLGTNIPPLVNSYMKISSSIRMFGTAINHELHGIDDTGILVVFEELNEETIRRHINALLSSTVEKAKKRFPNIKPGFEERLKERWINRRIMRFKNKGSNKLNKSVTNGNTFVRIKRAVP